MSSPPVAWQASLLDAATEPEIDQTFANLARIRLDDSSWVDHAPGWVSGSDHLFAELLDSVEWGQRSRHMYDKKVVEPRLTAWWRADAGQALEPPLLESMRRALSGRYGVELDSMGLNLYRDGRDSVAWHGDRIAKEIAEPIVAIVSVGEPRRFLLRPRDRRAGGTRTFLLGRGDLLVTGGACQREWEHGVPKVANAGPRISITFRHGLDPRAYEGKSRAEAGLTSSSSS
jgi:alkylated DNA repair dioxygenase AlkB